MVVNFTRRNLMSRILIDFVQDGNKILSDNYPEMAVVSFFHLLGVAKEEADPQLVTEVKDACGEFVTELRRRWKSSRVARHKNLLEKYHGSFLDGSFSIPFLEPKKPTVPSGEDQAAPVQNQQPPAPNVTVQDNPTAPGPSQPPSKQAKKDVPFLERVR